MDEKTLIAIVGITVGLLQGLILFILTGMRFEIRDIWKRMYSHYHEVECANNGCVVRKTGNVIVPHESS